MEHQSMLCSALLYVALSGFPALWSTNCIILRCIFHLVGFQPQDYFTNYKRIPTFGCFFIPDRFCTSVEANRGTSYPKSTPWTPKTHGRLASRIYWTLWTQCCAGNQQGRWGVGNPPYSGCTAAYLGLAIGNLDRMKRSSQKIDYKMLSYLR